MSLYGLYGWIIWGYWVRNNQKYVLYFQFAQKSQNLVSDLVRGYKKAPETAFSSILWGFGVGMLTLSLGLYQLKNV